MRKYGIIFFFWCVCGLMAYAGKIKTVIFADTDDESIGCGVRGNIGYTLNAIAEIAASLDMVKELEEVQVFSGGNCNPTNLRNWIKNFHCGADDIVFFFYFGHGGRAVNDKSQFPQMCLGQIYEDQFIPLEDVQKELKKKGPRFSLVFGDCCNTSDSRISTKFGVLSAAGATEIKVRQSVAMKKLFLEQKGSILASGSQVGYPSWYSNDRVNKTGFGCFTLVFVSLLDEYTSKAKNPNWDDLMRNVANSVTGITRDWANQNQIEHKDIQTPIFITQLTSIVQNKPKEQKTILPLKNNDLREMLIGLADERRGPSVRLEMVPSIRTTYFHPSKAWVDVVGRNNKTIVYSGSVQDYLDRVATSLRLKNFAVQEQRKDVNGKITYLKIHEIYKD